VEVATAELRRLNNHLERTAEEERSKIAREIHDDLGQDMTGIRLQLAAIEANLGEQERALLSPISGSLELMHENIRRILMLLRPRILEDLGLPGAIDWLISSIQENSLLEIDAQIRVPRRLPARIELAAFRILQEALTNVRRHAKARHVFLQVEAEESWLILRVLDDGVGVQGDRRGRHGISGMVERAAAVGGTLALSENAPRGVRVEARLPLGPVASP
jgi:hypothetical protein